MTTRRDELLDAPEPDRVNYRFGVMLDHTDFVVEQSYHRGRLARALAYLHGYGTAAGLEVVWEERGGPDDEEIVIRPGIAVDPIGRLIEVPRDRCVRLRRWLETWDADKLRLYPAGIVADVFIRFAPCEREKTPAFAHGNFDALDAVVGGRIRDGVEIRMVPRTEDSPPVPVTPWSALDGASPAERFGKLSKAILGAWRAAVPQGVDPETERLLRPEREIVPAGDLDRGLDWLFLARVTIPATPGSDGGRPSRGPGDVDTNNEIRPFAIPVAALARCLL